MKRIELAQEFHGEGDRCDENWTVEQSGNDEIVLDVVGGSVSFVAPSAVSDDEVLDKNLADRFICCSLELENGAELHIWINEGANGVDFRLTPAHKNHVLPKAA